jgi:methylmalonyl-CoA mutase
VHTARSSFAANLFQAGGIETVLSEKAGGSPADQPDLAALAGDFTASGARAACICSSDAMYAQYAAEAAAALKAAGAGYVVLAGRPGDLREAYQQAGIDGYVYAGCDALAALTTVLEKIGASR